MGDAACGFPEMKLFGGATRGHAGKDGGLEFGSCNLPVPGKDHDRQAYLRLGALAPGEKTPSSSLSSCLAFGLFDGHGVNSSVSELAASSLLPAISNASIDSSCSDLRSNSSSTSTRSNGSSSTLSSESGADAVEVTVDDPEEEARACSLLERANTLGQKRAEHCLVAGFKHLSQKITTQFESQRVGSTATVILVSRRTGSLPPVSGAKAAGTPAWDITCAWVGDSRAVLIGPDGHFERTLSEDHRLELPREFDRVMAVQRAESGTCVKGERTTVVAHRVCNSTGRQGPQVIFNEKTGVSTMVTRTFGDSLGATALTDEPELCSCSARAGSRIVICSDGVWDVMSHEKVASLIKRVKNPRAAAKALCSAAKKARLYGGFSTDDISAIVINLNDEKIRKPN